MDQLQYVWSGEWPENRAPSLTALTANGQDAFSSVAVDARGLVTFEADVTDPEGEDLRYEWELLPESTDIRAGGDAETRPDAVRLDIADQDGGTLAIRAPRVEGPYRMFVYAYDGHGNVATANFPFYVGRPTP